jgi:hypothetical protein
MYANVWSLRSRQKPVGNGLGQYEYLYSYAAHVVAAREHRGTYIWTVHPNT